MAHASGYISGKRRTLYMLNTFATDAPTYAQLTHSSDGVVLAANLVKGVQSVGPIGASGTSESFNTWGSGTGETESGNAEREDTTIVVNIDYVDSQHQVLLGLDVGDDLRLAIVATRGASKAATVHYLKGEVSGSSLQPASADGGSWDQLTITTSLVQDAVMVAQA